MKGLASQLMKAGLTSIQAKTYVSVLQIGPAPASEIAKHAEINRVTSYTSLEELESMGLVRSSDDSAVRLFQSTPAENLEKHFMQQAQHAIQSYRYIQALIPDLQHLSQGQLNYPEITYLDGITAARDYLNNLPDSCVLQALCIENSNHYELIRPLIKHAADLDIRPRALIPNSVKPSLLVYLDHRVIPAKIVQFPASTLLMNDRMGFITDQNSLMQLMIVHDVRIAKQFTSLFGLIWRIISGEHVIVPHDQSS